MIQDNKIFDLINKERKRQTTGIELIASENFVSENVSKEIVYMFSFIVFINAGYFTFMLILDILKAETYI